MKEKEKNTDKKSKERLLEMELTGDESDGFGLEHMSSDSDSAEDNDDKENVYLGNDDINEMLHECDPHHLLYILEMILVSMHGTNVEHRIQLVMKMDTKMLTMQFVKCSWPLKHIFHMVYQMDGSYKNSIICFIY